VISYQLATWIVTCLTGNTVLHEDLGQMNLINYPIIAIPSMVIMLAIAYFIWCSIRRLTDLKLVELPAWFWQTKLKVMCRAWQNGIVSPISC
jgi:hypothetical protein